MSVRIFSFCSKRQEGWCGAHEGCHAKYWLPGCAVVRVSTYGRRHMGWIQFSFTSQADGQPCTAEEWCDDANVVRYARSVRSYTSAGLTISMATSGRSHSASFSVEPTTEHTCRMVRGRAAGNEVTNVLTNEPSEMEQALGALMFRSG